MASSLEQETPRRTKRRRQLLATAAERFQESGYQNVSMEEIAAAVGITGPALYRHFRSKHDLLFEALSAQLELVERVTSQVGDVDGDAETKLFWYIDALARLVIGVDEILLWKRERIHLTGDERLSFRERLRKLRSDVAGLITAWRPELTESEAQFLGWSLLSINSNLERYRSQLDAGELAGVLARMSRAVITSEFPKASDVATPVLSETERAPVGRRERVMRATAILFDQHGYHAVSMEEIAAASKTAIATVYELFASKSELLYAILDRGAQGTLFLTSHRLAYQADEVAALGTVVDTYLELVVGPHRRITHILEADFVYLRQDDQRLLRRIQAEYVEEWVAQVIRVRPQLSPGEARALAHTTIGLISETAQVAYLRARPNFANELRLLAGRVLDC